MLAEVFRQALPERGRVLRLNQGGFRFFHHGADVERLVGSDKKEPFIFRRVIQLIGIGQSFSLGIEVGGPAYLLGEVHGQASPAVQGKDHAVPLSLAQVFDPEYIALSPKLQAHLFSIPYYKGRIVQ